MSEPALEVNGLLSKSMRVAAEDFRCLQTLNKTELKIKSLELRSFGGFAIEILIWLHVDLGYVIA